MYTNSLQEKRDRSIDILKGIGIVLMVYGHTFSFGHDYIYLFHMSIFFMASGYLFSVKKISSTVELKRAFIKKIKTLYIPYVLCNFLSLSLTNIFIKLNIYTDNPAFITAMSGSPIKQVLTQKLEIGEYLKDIVKILLGRYTTQIENLSWFLFVLFIVTIMHLGVSYLFNKMRRYRIVICVFTIAFYIVIASLPFSGEIKRFGAASIAFQLGIIVKQVDSKKLYNTFTSIFSAITLLVMTKIGTIELAGGRIISIPFFIVASLLGWTLIFSISRYIERKNLQIIQTICSYFGRNTLPILLLHLISFKLVNLIYVFTISAPKYIIASFHVIFGLPWYFSIFYTIVGIIVPLITSEIIRNAKKLILDRFVN